MKNLTTTFLALIYSACAFCQTTLWQSDTLHHQYFRIPAIIAYGDNAIAFSDNRSGVTDATVWGDVGSVGNICIEARFSSDRGNTWSEPKEIVTGFGDGTFDQSHGDAAVVRDRTTGRLLMMCASGTTGYGRSHASVADNYATALQVGRYYSTDNGHTWNGRDVTRDIYSIFNNGDNSSSEHVDRLFFASGRICQSRLIKKGCYYRIYSALTTNRGALVVYSDDFGTSWHALGGANANPAPQGDESKIEELPDGSVVLSCRMMGGRYFNIFKYADSCHENGTWSEPVASTSTTDGTAAINNATNGELLILPVINAKGDNMWLALQSTPRGSEGNHPSNRERRSHVSIYWKAFANSQQLSDLSQWISGWSRHEVTTGYSAYSTMNAYDNGELAFLYEDNSVRFKLGSQHTEVYDVVYRTISLQDITNGEYRYLSK